jgi:glycine C-acetyltransferase
MADAGPLANFCSNNYLGLASHPSLLEAGKSALDRWGYGMASVRFICGTSGPHLELERRVSEFLGTAATLLYSSCFDANAGVFATLFGADDAIVSDELNHASIIDGIRLSKAMRFRYRNRDLVSLRQQLEAAQQAGARFTVVVTDGVFSMDGYIAPLDGICELASQFDALVLVDDSHAVGVLGPGGRGTPALLGVAVKVDILTGTFGKALGGASGGYVSGHQAVIDLLRQRSRPYLFSNSLSPVVVGGTLAALDLLENSDAARCQLLANAELFRSLMTEAGFDLLPGVHPIVAVMFGEVAKATAVASQLQNLGFYVTAFSFPVVPEGQARIRVQLSANHSEDQIRSCVRAFIQTASSANPQG